MARKIVFGVIIFLFTVQLLAHTAAAVYAGETIRPDRLIGQVLLLMLPVRSVHPDETRLYSAMLYRVASIPTDGGKRKYKVQFYPKNFEPWGE